MLLADKTVLITGAANGIGLAAAQAALAQGAIVWAADRAPMPDAAAGEPRLRARLVDVTDMAGIDALVAEAGRLDVLVNCAGIVQQGTLLDTREAELDRGIDVNLKSMWRTIRAVLPGMLAQGDGAIVNVSSIGSSIKSTPNRFVYHVSKAGVIGLTKSVAADFGPRGIRCNAVCPGPIDSPSMRERLGEFADAQARMLARIPMGRLGTADEVAALIVYLATATFTNGQVHIIDGGMTS